MGRNMILSVLALFISVSTVSAADWKLVWSDEFNYKGLPDAKKWASEVGFVRNRELQYYTRGRMENARVANGRLVIESRKEKFKNPDYRPDSSSGRWKYSREYAGYTSASVTTQGKAAWPYDKQHYLILNTEIGGSWGGRKGIDESVFPQKFYIDYVRVYQK